MKELKHMPQAGSRCKESAECVTMCYDFDIAINMCTQASNIRDIRCKIFAHFTL